MRKNSRNEMSIILEEMGFCPKCHDHMPCGCNDPVREVVEETKMVIVNGFSKLLAAIERIG